MRSLLVFLVLLSSVISLGQGQEIPTGDFPYMEKMDDNYDLFWNFNRTHIVFKVTVRTKGYIGLGISANGNMFPGDVVIGWIDEGGWRHFADRYASGHFTPAIDVSQDWFLLEASETQTTTTLTMIRELETCDPFDIAITKSTMRIIYAYHPNKPISDVAIPYHGHENRGTKSVLLLLPPSASANPMPLPSDFIARDFLNNNFRIPARNTYYSCTIFKLDDLQGKHHMIRVEPQVQAGHERNVHHMLIYSCPNPDPDPLLDALVGSEYECYEAIPEGAENCFHTIVGWGIGGRGYDYPAHVGLSMGAAGDHVYFRMETHYDNPTLRDDLLDSSGLRLIFTQQLRQYDAGILTLGSRVSAYMIIPPFNPGFLVQGYCHHGCLAEGLGDQEIHVVGNILHSHLLGRKLRARIIREGVELPFLQADENYDFNFQEFVALPEERTIKRGDAIIVDCEYDSSERTEVTYGGLGTRHEMCLTFLLYYPRVNLTSCLSRPIYKEVQANGSEAFFERISQTDWTSQQAQRDFRQTLDEADIFNVCYVDSATENFEVMFDVIQLDSVCFHHQFPLPGLNDDKDGVHKKFHQIETVAFHQTQTSKVNVTQPFIPPDPCSGSFDTIRDSILSYVSGV